MFHLFDSEDNNHHLIEAVAEGAASGAFHTLAALAATAIIKIAAFGGKACFNLLDID